MRKTLITLFFLNFLIIVSFGQKTVSKFTEDSERRSFKEMCHNTFKNIDYNDEKSISKGLWIISAFNQKGDPEDLFIRKLLNRYDSLSAMQQYNLLSAIADRKLSGKKAFLNKVLLKDDLKQKILAYSLLSKEDNKLSLPLINNDDWNCIAHQINNKVFAVELSMQQIDECFSFIKRHYPVQSHIFVLLRANRDIPAKVYVVDSLGVRGGLAYLGRSAYNILPYFTNGNTPCGVFKIIKKTFSNNQFIGPVQALQTVLPFEVTPKKWGIDNDKWSVDVYKEFLPSNLQNEQLLWQAYWAGKVGRGDIIVHGSTIDPLFFSDQPFFPLTPSLGCLSALEIWSNGDLLESHQQRLVDDLPSDKNELGFMYVLQVDEETYNHGLINK